MEDILPLNADHSGMCKFDPKDRDDESNYELVLEAMTGLYEKAMNRSAGLLTEAPNAPNLDPMRPVADQSLGQGACQ